MSECVGCGARGRDVRIREVKVALTGYVYKALLCNRCGLPAPDSRRLLPHSSGVYVCRECGEPVFKARPGPGRYPTLCATCRE